MKNRLCMVALVAVAAVLWGTVAPAQAEGFAPRKYIYGYVSLGAGALLLKGAYDARRDAGDIYDNYRAAQRGADAQTLFDDTRGRDTRSVVLGALGVGAVAYSVRLLRAEKREQQPLPPLRKWAGERPAVGEQGWFTQRRSWGLAFVGGSLFMLKKGWNFRGKANELYDLYRQADTAAAAEDFYERSDNRQTKSQMSWGVAAAFAAVGYQLLLVDGREKELNSSVVHGRGALARVDFEPQIELGRVGFRLSRRFF